MTKVNSTKNNAIPNHETAPVPVALFDLDYTLITSDCTAYWLRHMLTRTLVRKLLILSLLPVIKLLGLFKVSLVKRNSMYLWAATVGLNPSDYLALRRSAVEYLLDVKGLRAFSDGIDRIQWHKSQGHKVVIVTGALRWLARDVCQRLNIHYDSLLGSSERTWFGGRVSKVFCYHQNKVNLLEQHKELNKGKADYGYSDSAADIPMLSACKHIYIVNPKPDCQHQFEQAFGTRPTILNWRTKLNNPS